LIGLLTDTIARPVKQRLDRVMGLQPAVGSGLTQARAYTGAVLGMQVYANTLYRMAKTNPHATAHAEA
jgi:hypothetical protein